MADSTPLMPQMAAAADDREIVFNGSIDPLTPSGLYGRNYLTCTGLVFGGFGGFFNTVEVANWTVTATASNTNYVVAHRTTGVVSISTATTNRDNTTTYMYLYELIAGVSAITSYKDKRQALGAAAPVLGGGAIATDTLWDAKGDLAGGTGSNTAARLAVGANGTVLTADSGEATGLKWVAPVKYIQFACSDLTTALAAGTGKAVFRMPCALTVTGVRASLGTAQATNGAGGIFTVDINEAGTTILSTKLTIDNTEKTSTTAATPPVISDSAIADDAEITVDIDQIGDGTAKGLVVTIIGT